MTEQKKENGVVDVRLQSADIGNMELGSVPYVKSFDLYKKLAGAPQSKCRKVTVLLETPLDGDRKPVLYVRPVLRDGPCCAKRSGECDCVQTLGAGGCPDQGMQALMKIIKEHTK